MTTETLAEHDAASAGSLRLRMEAHRQAARHAVDLLLKFGGHLPNCSSHFGPECYCGWEEVERDMKKVRGMME